MSKEIKIMLGIVVVVLGLGAFLFFKSPAPHQAPADAGKLVRDNSNMTGSKDAKVTLVEFGDFECPYCGQFSPTAEQIMANYQSNKNFNFVFRNFPLPQHQYSHVSAEAAEAAGAQGKYWEIYKLLYQNQNAWANSSNPQDLFATYAQQLGLNVDQFKSDVQSNKYQDKIQEDVDDANALGVNATPTLYLNGQQINPSDFNTLKGQIDALLK